MIDLQKISFLCLMLCTFQSILACDICSCGASNNTSFTSGLNSNYMGLSYNYVHFTYKEGIVENSPTANDYIHTVTILGQYFITEKIQVNAVIPYRFNKREASTGTVKNNGLGDATLYGLLSLLQKESKHSLKIGAGLKLPTGTFNLQRATINQTSATQLGTGSLDMLFPFQYRYEYKKVAFSANGAYFIKNKNSDNFKYGNQTQLNFNVAYAVALKKNNTITPSLGINYDNFKPTERFGIVDKRTSGFMTNANLGLKANIDTWVVGINYQAPIHQKLIEDEVRFEKSVGVFTYYRF